MTQPEIVLRLHVDAQPVQQGVAQARRAVESLGTTNGPRTLASQARAAREEMDGLSVSAAQYQAAMRGLPAQMTDIVTSLASGQQPLTVMLQQGGQLKDMFGGTGNAVRALGGYLRGLLNPYTVAIGAIAGLTLAYQSGRNEMAGYQRALLMTGNAAGVTGNQLADMARAMDENGDTTQANASKVLTALAQTGKVQGDLLQRAAQAAMDLERYGGVAVEQTVDAFADLGREPVAASERLNSSMRYLTASVYEQIVALDNAGRSTEAAKLAQEAYANALSERAGEMAQNLGWLERGWNAVKSATAEAIDAMKDVGRAETTLERLQSKQQEILRTQASIARAANAGGAYGDQQRAVAGQLQQSLQALRTEEAALQEQMRLEGRSLALKQQAQDQEQAKVKWLQEGNRYLSEQERYQQAINQQRELGRKAGLSEAEIAERVAKIPAPKALAGEAKKFADALRRANDEIAKMERAQLPDTTRRFEDGRARAEEMARAVAPGQRDDVIRRYMDALSEMVAAEEAAAESDAYSRAITARNEQYKTMREEVEALERQVAQFGLARSELERLTLARQESELADLQFAQASDQSNAALADQIALLKQRIALQQRKVVAADELELKDGLQKAEAEADRVFERVRNESKTTAQNLNRTLANGVIDAFKQGENAGERLMNALESMFLDLTLRPTLEMVMAPVSQSILDLLGTGLKGVLGGSSAPAAVDPGGIFPWFGGGRAAGGPVQRGRMYEVNEQAPELLAYGGRTFLMMGAQDGDVIPASRVAQPPMAGQGAAGGGGESPVMLNVSLDARGADAGAVARLEAAMQTLTQNIKPLALQAVREAQLRSRVTPSF
ncbi:phage tail length tape measure family protein [Chitiniphilus purpureus]|uniref:Phage tail length tape measure family protein n=1 Tax=Chitiniphilus purpureus TaxID=2981137 RepID=A0ABY6DHP6_9NEIS|nr:phage tail length tape measure family protein [Chitiniphilus sp. CD1]UXY13867.1 phage tail length tape measure family protein [Chitiniphilus sp. CD1]